MSERATDKRVSDEWESKGWATAEWEASVWAEAGPVAPAWTSTALLRAITSLGVPFESSLSGRWVKLLTESTTGVFVEEYAWGDDCLKHYLVFVTNEHFEPTGTGGAGARGRAIPDAEPPPVGQAIRAGEAGRANPHRPSLPTQRMVSSLDEAISLALAEWVRAKGAVARRYTSPLAATRALVAPRPPITRVGAQ